MRSTALLRKTLALACAAAMWSCGGGGSPSSPSAVTAPAPPGSGLLRPADEHETPEPAPEPVPDPPPPLIVSIVGSFGSTAFAPNPIPALAGNTILWTNSDLAPHNIVLNDGTLVGFLAPGQSSAPVAFSGQTVGYRCTIHPSMVGTISDAAAPAPPPYEPPPYEPPPDDGYVAPR
jgi:hypothetical protein